MNKYLKIISTIIIVSMLCMCFFSSTSLAEIDMNLTSDSTTNTETENLNNVETTPATTTNSTSNTNTAGATNTQTSSATVSTLNSLPESELGLTNILNILLITVGFLLILLGIAIIIKLKK